MMRKTRYLLTIAWFVTLVGCAAAPAPLPPAPAPPPVGAPTIIAVAPPAAPAMTLPKFLGLDSIARGVGGGVRYIRLRVAERFPALQPTASAAPKAIGDPANLASPSPAVASAAAIQQAAADAPAKAKALGFLATLDCSQHPQVEEAYLAGLDDLSEEVRAAAAQAIIDSQRQCAGGCKSCNSSGGCGQTCNECCTPAIRAKLTCMAYEMKGPNCYCEPSPRVRRLCRLALCSCGGAVETVNDVPLELPPAAIIELVQ